MKNIQNLNKESVICIIIFLIMVMFFLQPCIFSKLFQTILGRIFLVILIIYVSYCNQILGVLFVLFLMIMSNHDSIIVEGFDLGDPIISMLNLERRRKEANTPEGKAGSAAILSVDKSTDPHKIFLKKVATIVQNYSYDNKNPIFFSVKPLQKTLLDELNIVNTARFSNPTAAADALAKAQLNYLENLAIIGEKIISQYPSSESAKKIKEAKQAEIEASIKAEPRPMAPSVLTQPIPNLTIPSLSPISTVNATPLTKPIITVLPNVTPSVLTPPVTQEPIINTVFGTSAGNVVDIPSVQQDEIKQNNAAADAITMGKNSTIAQTNYQSKAAEIAQKYSDDHPGNLYGVVPAKIQLLKAVTAANTPGNVNTQGQVKMAQMIYLETLERIARNIASNLGPSSPEAVALKKVQDERDAKIAGSIITSKPTIIMEMPSPTVVTSTLTTPIASQVSSPTSIGTQSTMINNPSLSQPTITLTPPKKSFTCVESFKPLEGFDLLGLEDRMKRGKQSNSIQVGNSYNNSDDVMPYEKSFFSPFRF